MTPVGKKVRVIVHFVARRMRPRRRDRIAAARRDAKDPTASAAKRIVPSGPQLLGRARRVANRLRQPTSNFNPLQFPFGEEAERAAVRRPERVRGAHRTIERLRLRSVQCAYEQLRAAFVGDDEDESLPVGRYDRGRAEYPLKPASVRRVDLEPHAAACGGEPRVINHATASAATTTAVAATSHGSRLRHVGCGSATPRAAVISPDALMPELDDNASSANARSLADWNRAAGFFSRHRSTSR